LISDAVSIPVIASSGAGGVEHFSEVFAKTNASAALAAGMFHRKEVQLYKYFLHFIFMQMLMEIIIIFSSFSFLFYGGCFLSS
jgi:imidazole glycerol phosphate synthase subunit HisF